MERLANRILLTTGWRRALLAFAAGAATVLAQAPFHIFAVCFLTFPVLVWLLDGAISRPTRSWFAAMWPAFATGWMFGFGYFVAGLWWIGNALFVEAKEFIWLWPFAVLALPAVLAAFYGMAAVLARALWSDGVTRIAALAFGFGVAEWLRNFAFTGFPWNAIGYAAMPAPLLMQPASLVGVFGMNALAVLVFALPACFAGARWRAGLSAIFILVLVAGDLGFGYWRLQNQPDTDIVGPAIRIVQPAVDQSEKWDTDRRREIFDNLLNLTAEPAPDGALPDIVVWPETSVPFILTDEPDAVAAIAAKLEAGQTLLAGAVRVGEPSGDAETAPVYFNSILAIDDRGVIFDAADKKHLVPFGEYLPFAALMDRLGFKAVAAADRGYSGASIRRTLTLPDGVQVLPSICYEAIFPSESGADGDPATVIVNVTNDAWYGHTPGPYQHLHQARIRAVETGLPLVRAANTGISAVFDGYGRQHAALGFGVAGAVDATLPAPLDLPYYAEHGTRAYWAVFLGLALLGLTGRLAGSRAKRRFLAPG